jgi:hypothetical protein
MLIAAYADLILLVVLIFYLENKHRDIQNNGNKISNDNGYIAFKKTVNHPQNITGKHHNKHKERNIAGFFSFKSGYYLR